MLTNIQPVPRVSNTSILSIKSCITDVNVPDMSSNLNNVLVCRFIPKDVGD